MAIRTIDFQNKELVRFSRFALVGALGTALDFGLLTGLKFSGLPTLAANTFSFSAGLANNYILNSHWTFADRNSRENTTRFFQFFLVSIVGLAINNAIVILLEVPFGNRIGDPAWGYVPAKAVATGVVVFWNYFVNRNWTFKAL